MPTAASSGGRQRTLFELPLKRKLHDDEDTPAAKSGCVLTQTVSSEKNTLADAPTENPTGTSTDEGELEDKQSDGTCEKESDEHKENEEGGRKPARLHKCEDRWHVASEPHTDVRKCTADDVYRCCRCRTNRRKAEKTVGNRGLSLQAFFRRNCATPQAKNVLADTDAWREKKVSLSSSLVVPDRDPPTTPPLRPSARLDGSSSPSGISDRSVIKKPRCEKKDADPDWAGYASEDEDGKLTTDDSVDLWLGCDNCSRWYMVDDRLEAHWRDQDFVCANIGETCEEGEEYQPTDPGAPTTALVSLPGSEDLRARGDGEQNFFMPEGCWDVYRKGSDLAKYQPSEHPEGLVVYVAPLAAADEATRLEAEKVLHAGFVSEGARNCITNLCGLRDGTRVLRSGSRAQAVVGKDGQRMWLIWETVPDASVEDGRRTVGAAILHWQQYVKTGPEHLRGGAVLEYIAADQAAGGRGYPLLLGAEEVCHLLGMKELFSACDLSHKGQAFNGKATPALTAHRRWGFQDIAPEEWEERRFAEYTRDSTVHYMVKQLRLP